MKPNSPIIRLNWFALAFAITGCAVACAIQIFRHQEPTPSSPGAVTKIKTSAGVQSRLTQARTSNFSATQRTRSEARRQNPAGDLASTATMKILKVGGAPLPGMSPVISESQWRAQASQVEMEASRELDRLVGLLDLDSGQQDQVFSALAQQSRSWLPGMLTGRNESPTTPPATSSDVTAYLTADQQQILIQEEMDRQAWWADVIPQLLPPALPGDTLIVSEPTIAVKAFDDSEAPPEE
jgi:hypothetical protein